MLLPSLLALSLFAQFGRYPVPLYSRTPPYIPVVEQYADYPVQVRILETHWNFDRGTYIGYGRADLLGPDHRGLDFTYSCGEPFRPNQQPGDAYGAKWKKEDSRLELLLQEVGTHHTTRCTLKTSVRGTLYSPDSIHWLPASAPPASPRAPMPAAPPASNP